MHRQARQFVESVKSKLPQYFKDSRVLEVGSLNINGSCRDMFTDCEYVGVDITEGEGVDIVGRFEAQMVDPYFDVVYSTEALEHDQYWLVTFYDMWWRCNGLIFFTCATTGRREHGTHDHSPDSSPGTNDYYMNLTEQDFRDSWLTLDEMFSEFEFSTNEQSHDLYFWGICR